MSIYDRFRLDGKVALITGGGRGLGRAMAIAFAEAGADIAISARHQGQLAETARAVAERGRRVHMLAADMTSPTTPEELLNGCVAELGDLNILVNNAGGAMGHPVRPLMETEEAAWSDQISLNLSSYWRMTKVAAGKMRSGDCVLNISSITAIHPYGTSGPYAAAKAAVNNMTKAFSKELAPDIRVNGIAPGPIPTEGFRAARNVSEKDYDRVAAEWGVPLARLGTPEDVAAAALYLASPAGAWMTGETMVLAGGM